MLHEANVVLVGGGALEREIYISHTHNSPPRARTRGQDG